METIVWKLDCNNNYATQIIHPPTGVTAFLSLDHASRFLPGGAYTTFRTFHHNHVLRLNDHFVRLSETSRLTDKPVELNTRLIRDELRRLLQSYPAAEGRVRITVDLEQEPGSIFLSIEELCLPTQDERQNGVKVITRVMQRANPKAKLSKFLETAATIRQTLPTGVNEVVMLNQNNGFLEGLSSNFFAVIGKTLWTAEEGVLSGLTRKMVLEGAHQLGMNIQLESISASMLSKFDEAFITSTSRSILPVTQIDRSKIATGSPGIWTQKLAAWYEDEIEKQLEPV